MGVKTKAALSLAVSIAGNAFVIPDSQAAQTSSGTPVQLRGADTPPPPPPPTLPLKLVAAKETYKETPTGRIYVTVTSCAGDGTTCPIRK